jgi:uncharacterized protein (DUF4213/DUF364 family)
MTEGNTPAELADDYLKIVKQVADAVELPAVSGVYFNLTSCDARKSSKFGALVLEDGTVGLTYVDLGEARQEFQDTVKPESFAGAPVLELARLYAEQRDWQRVLGMAAINAISQYLFIASRYPLVESTSTVEMLDPGAHDHIGMVGYFPSLVQRIRDMKLPLTVIELDPQWLQQGDNFEVTLDPSRLSGCNKILCTGTMLINQTLDPVLQFAGNAEQIIQVGPTVGCLPDPLFCRGITAVGGRQVVDCEHFLELWKSGEPWNVATRRYSIAAGGYPGYQELIERARAHSPIRFSGV